MSFWTYVDATVEFKNNMDLKDFIALVVENFGRQIDFDDPIEAWYEYMDRESDYLFCGSEGSLQYAFVMDAPTPVVRMRGNLRDVASPESAVKWFEEKCSDMPFYNYISEARIKASLDGGWVVAEWRIKVA